MAFLSTLPARGSDDAVAPVGVPGDISIHAPREGSDPTPGATAPWQNYFYPRSPRGERPSHRCRGPCPAEFLSTLPARGATTTTGETYRVTSISIHAPARGATCRAWSATAGLRFLSTLPARGATYLTYDLVTSAWEISIHAPREGSDLSELLPAYSPAYISIHAPREGSDKAARRSVAWRAHFYPRSPRGERHEFAQPGRQGGGISIHAPREGSDGPWTRQGPGWKSFLSTLPARGATRPHPCRKGFFRISIHAPREGSDSPLQWVSQNHQNFYPRSPRGERPFWK